MKPQLIFVYNADSGLFNTVTDIAHKILSPNTYSCQLCQLTHSYFTVKKEWTGFLEDIDADCEFLHRDEFQEKYQPDNMELPAIYLNENGKASLWINQSEINDCNSIGELRVLIKMRLDQAKAI